MSVIADATAADLPVLPAIDEPRESFVLAKVAWRLLPFMFLLYVINLIDRTNIGIVKRQMLIDLKMDTAAYGMGAGLFYIGYLVFEVPSNLIMVRTGARIWIARILITWGLISSAFMFVEGPRSFYAMRILLGAAEAGFFPGVILYLSQWFPRHARARAVSLFMIGGPVAGMIGNPVSGSILKLTEGSSLLWGWQWVFLLEGIPAIIMGIVTYWFLTDRPDQAHWLLPAERDWLVHRMEEERAAIPEQHRSDLLVAALCDPRVWLLTAIYFTVAVGDNAFGFFLPSLLQARFPGLDDFRVGLLAAVPNIVAIAAMVAVAIHSDRTGERRWHVAFCAFAAAAGWALLAIVPSPWMFIAALALTVAGMKGMLPTFWTLPTSLLGGTTAAAVIALINSVANLGGFFAPMAVGKIQTATGSYVGAMLMVAGVLVGGGVLLAVNRRLLTPRANVEYGFPVMPAK